MPTPLTDSDKVLRNDTGKSIASKLDDIKTAIENQSSSLNNLSDVSISSPADKQALLYDGTENKWKNRAIAESDVTGLSTDLSGKMDKANPTGTGSLSLNRKSGTMTGSNSVATGLNCEASGYVSSAEGSSTVASGSYTHCEGIQTIAQRRSQHVFGEFNVADTGGSGTTVKGTYIEIVGKGTADNARSNARTLDWSGNEVLAGTLKVNNTKEVATKEDISYVGSASGSIATFSDGGNNIPMKSCEVAIVALQAGTGTPSPSNPRPIIGFDSVVINNRTKNILNTYANAEGNGYINGYYLSSNGTHTSSYGGFVSEYTPIKPNTIYTMSGCVGLSPSICFYSDKSEDSYINGEQYNSRTSFSFTTPANAKYFRCTVANDKKDTMMIEEGSTATTYEPFGTTHTITLPETIYGGTAELVGGNGVKTYEYVSIDGTESDSLYGVSSTQPVAFYRITNAVNFKGLCNKAVNAEGKPFASYQQGDFTIYSNGFYFYYDGTKTVSYLKTYLAGMGGYDFIYETTSPTAFTFTGANIPTLSGVNNVYADSGDVDLEYFNENADEIADLIRAFTR